MYKRFRIVAIVLALTLVVGVPTALALTAYANVRADFYVYDERNEPDAGAYAIFNYVKGQDMWNVSGEIWNARPDTYTLSVGTAGITEGNEEIVHFTTDETGYASFSAQVDDLPAEYDIARIYEQGKAVRTELTAPESEGLLKARGTGRYKMENGMCHD